MNTKAWTNEDKISQCSLKIDEALSKNGLV